MEQWQNIAFIMSVFTVIIPLPLLMELMYGFEKNASTTVFAKAP